MSKLRSPVPRGLILQFGIQSSDRSAGKTKRPRLNLSGGTFVDQPFPKCCSGISLTLSSDPVNGARVPCKGTKVDGETLDSRDPRTAHTSAAAGFGRASH